MAQSFEALQAEIEAGAQQVLSSGVSFLTIVHTHDAKWIALHAKDQGQGGAQARAWVDVMGNRGASCWRLYPWGLGPEPLYSYTPELSWMECEAEFNDYAGLPDEAIPVAV